MKQLTLEKAIDITWLSVALSFCWPLPSNTSKTRIAFYKILQISSNISACLVLLAVIYSIYLHSENIFVVCKCIFISIGVSQEVIQTTVCMINHDSLQYVVEEMLHCVKEAQPYEREIYYKLVAKCSTLFGSSVVLYVIVYIHEAFLGFRSAAHICLSMFGALLLWFTAARFECLAIEMKQTADVNMLIVCIEKQLYLRRFAQEVVSNFRFIVLYAVGDTPLILRVQLLFASTTVLLEIYIYVWPADYMRDMSIRVSRSIYDTVWYKQTLELQKDILNVLVYQEPITLSISCIIPELSLHYFCSYLSNVFSIFTALRVVVEND
ncbi:hypothetical protein QLX08_010747 [Tetragonisca angustula]|uniref:Odorant receptor n=1 Tax=Tetragonisca angustula TaxID=166442 RepID=A0AAW0ZB22_9HYME